ncbi:hypothetical protein CDD81_8067 [Ophiocordyceps australis]|uniref:Uncharacterized protein n=1 Tax=Ophiocordyceps australis TaxID=1399860 RepID=A0A2C5Y1V8_9HYPO|nr:hypothetical protein CDD81_8067 [Ophiocordyceps australis]
MAQEPNPFLLAADNNPTLLPLLRGKPELASAQDDHGYSLLHAAASYNHLELLRTLVSEFNVNIDIKDEDDETPLFVVETPEAARLLVQELSANIWHTNAEGLTARRKLEAEGEFPATAAYLQSVEGTSGDEQVDLAQRLNPAQAASDGSSARTPLFTMASAPPDGVKVTVDAVDGDSEIPQEADPEFRRRIEELASRADFDSSGSQQELRRLVEDAILSQGLGQERSVRPRND